MTWWQIILLVILIIVVLFSICFIAIWIYGAIMQHKYIDKFKSDDPNYNIHYK